MNRDDFIKLVSIRRKEAKLLLENGRFHGCYYLIGYAVECALKACICKLFGRYQFPDKKIVNNIYSHNLENLLSIAGLKLILDMEIKTNTKLELNWTIIKDWSEEFRYETIISEQEANDIYYACTSKRNGILTWIRKKW